MRRLSVIHEEPVIKTKKMGFEINFKKNNSNVNEYIKKDIELIEGKSFFKNENNKLKLNKYIIFNYLKMYNKNINSIEIETV